ncbi:MAG: hypothetical protein U0269_37815 [Polyangiales bacterium]
MAHRACGVLAIAPRPRYPRNARAPRGVSDPARRFPKDPGKEGDRVSNVVPEIPPLGTDGEELPEPTVADLRLALLEGSFASGAHCLGLMREETIFAAGLGYATTHALLAVRTALIDNEDTRDCTALWAICRARVLQQLAREWEDGDGTQGLMFHASAAEFAAAVCDESARLPSVTADFRPGVWSIPVNGDGQGEELRELQGHLVRIISLTSHLRDIRSRATEEFVALSLGFRSEISDELRSAIERVRELDENPKIAVVQAVMDAASEWDTSDTSRNRTTCEGAALGLAEALGRTDVTEWSELLYNAARARFGNGSKWGSWYVATLALMERLDLERNGASKDSARRKALERAVSEWTKEKRIIQARRAG